MRYTGLTRGLFRRARSLDNLQDDLAGPKPAVMHSCHRLRL